MRRQTNTDVHGLSRAFHHIDTVTSRPTTVGIVGVATFIAVVGIAASGFSSELQFGFTTVAAAITLVMVFVIQHTQRREQGALQLKLDELIRAMPHADDRFVHLEVGSDAELEHFERQKIDHRRAALAEDDPAEVPSDPAPDSAPDSAPGSAGGQVGSVNPVGSDGPPSRDVRRSA